MEVKTESGGSFNAAGQGTTALGIIGTVLGGLATAMAGGNGLLNLGGNSNGGKCNANDSNTYVSKYELSMAQELSAKDSEIALLKSENNTENKMIEVYKQAHSEIAALRDIVMANKDAQNAWNTQQSVNNATMSAAIAANSNSIASLQTVCNSITKVVIPNSNVCPGWGAVTITPASSGTTVA